MYYVLCDIIHNISHSRDKFFFSLSVKKYFPSNSSYSSSSKSTVNEFLGCIKNKNLYIRMLLNLCGIEDKEFSINKASQKKINMTLFYI